MRNPPETLRSLLTTELDPARDDTRAGFKELRVELAENRPARTVHRLTYPLSAILIVALSVLVYAVYFKVRTSPAPVSASKSTAVALQADENGKALRVGRPPAARSSLRNRKSTRPRRAKFLNPPLQAASLSPEAFALIEQLAFAQPNLPVPADSSELHRPPAFPTFVAARPIHESLPNLRPEIRATIVSEVEVRIRVQVDESGRAAEADLVDLTGPANDILVSATREAALRWRFVPARLGTQPVTSEIALVFRYIPRVGE